MTKSLYSVEKECVLCSQKFEVTKVRNRLSMIRQDSDFCTYYKEVNPYYYAVWVCPHCGYAAQDSYFEELPAAADKIKGFLAQREVNVNFAGKRTWEQAIATYKLAVFFAQIGQTIPSRHASLFLKLAWLYREAGQTADEIEALDKARQYYEEAFLREKMPIGNLTEVGLEYLCGELLRRTGKLKEAVYFLGRVVTNRAARSEKRVYEMARDAWHSARDEIKQLENGDAPQSDQA